MLRLKIVFASRNCVLSGNWLKSLFVVITKYKYVCCQNIANTKGLVILFHNWYGILCRHLYDFKELLNDYVPALSSIYEKKNIIFINPSLKFYYRGLVYLKRGELFIKYFRITAWRACASLEKRNISTLSILTDSASGNLENHVSFRKSLCISIIPKKDVVLMI